MKKKYQQPEMLVVTLRTTQLLATSTLLGIGSGTKSASQSCSDEYDGDFEDEGLW